MYTLTSLIKKVDGQMLDPLSMEEFIKNLPNKDANYIVMKSTELNREVGLNNIITVKCDQCGEEL